MARRGHGRGTIRRRGDGRWEAIYEDGVNEKGRRKRRSIYASSRHEVQERLTAELHAQDNGTLADPRRATLGSFLAKWLEQVSVRESTRRHYRRNVELHIAPALGRIRLAKLTAADINALLQAKASSGLSPRSVHHIRAVLVNALGDAEKWGLVARNVARLTDAPHVPAFEQRFLSVDEARAFLVAAERDRFHALYVVTLSLGLREGEALGLVWDDVDLEGRTLHVTHALARIPGRGLQLVEPKTSSSLRTLHLPDVVVRALRAHRSRQIEERLAAGERWQDLGFVFSTYEGRPLQATHVLEAFRRLRAAVGIDSRFRFHDLRVSTATTMLAQGIPQRVVMEQLGHSTMAMTTHYTKVVPQLMKDAAAAMDRALGS